MVATPLTVSPSAGDLSGILQLHTVAGSGSGDVPLRYLQRDGHVYVLARADTRPGWVNQLLSSPAPARWRALGKEFIGKASIRSDQAEVAAVREGFTSQFGAAKVEGWFGRSVQCLSLQPTGEIPDDYARLVRLSFDSLAEDYDSLVEKNPFDLRLRETTREVLERTFHRGDRVLEIGAGTGLETLALARKGVHVVATDISPRMLNRLSEKAVAQRLESFVQTRNVRAADIALLQDEFEPGSFDGAFSDFGALNCEPDLSSVPEALAYLLRPGAALIVTVWNRLCLAETLAYLAVAKPSRAFARLRDPVPVGRSRFGIPVYARSAGEIVRLFKPLFAVAHVAGLPVFAPPYDLAARLQTHSLALELADEMDRSLSAVFPFNRLGDHFVLEMRRV
ncbi:MAG TPA: methyltransferase domain-containing protein [Thermoplasmata archaeon]|nr:methyltransferase domain-containing protein [Thermoplasmata archaeon]